VGAGEVEGWGFLVGEGLDGGGEEGVEFVCGEIEVGGGW